MFKMQTISINEFFNHPSMALLHERQVEHHSSTLSQGFVADKLDLLNMLEGLKKKSTQNSPKPVKAQNVTIQAISNYLLLFKNKVSILIVQVSSVQKDNDTCTTSMQTVCTHYLECEYVFPPLKLVTFGPPSSKISCEVYWKSNLFHSDNMCNHIWSQHKCP